MESSWTPKAISTSLGYGRVAEASENSDEVLHKVLHNSLPECPRTNRISTSQPISHNNIRKTERFRNRQVTSRTALSTRPF